MDRSEQNEVNQEICQNIIITNSSGNEIKIFGIDLDRQSRCIHYHSEVDVIANRCHQCGKLYACYQCHDALEDHSFAPSPTTEDSTLCGNCGSWLSFAAYDSVSECPVCHASFNPNCKKHQKIYYQTELADQ